MQLEEDEFSDFIGFLQFNAVLSTSEINDALEYLDGTEGVLSDGLFILGYEALARCIGGKLSFDELKIFAKKYNEVLSQDSGARYFFTQALVDKQELKQDERRELISLMPDKYQPFLLQRFF